MTTIPPELAAEIVTAYRLGLSCKRIEDMFGVSQRGLDNVLKRANIPRIRREIKPGEIDRVDFISSAARVPTVLENLPEFSTRKQPIAFDQTVFDVITPASAYWIGLLMADGCVTDENAIILALTDQELVEQFRYFMASDHAITKQKREGEQEIARLSIKSRRVCEVLLQYGITPRKTFTGKISLVENHPDFWRGYFDGDGTMHVPSGHVAVVGSDEIADQFVAFNKNLYADSSANIQKHHSSDVRVGYVSGKSAVLFLRSIYYNSSALRLSRKYERAKEIVARHNVTI